MNRRQPGCRRDISSVSQSWDAEWIWSIYFVVHFHWLNLWPWFCSYVCWSHHFSNVSDLHLDRSLNYSIYVKSSINVLSDDYVGIWLFGNWTNIVLWAFLASKMTWGCGVKCVIVFLDHNCMYWEAVCSYSAFYCRTKWLFLPHMVIWANLPRTSSIKDMVCLWNSVCVFKVTVNVSQTANVRVKTNGGPPFNQ